MRFLFLPSPHAKRWSGWLNVRSSRATWVRWPASAEHPLSAARIVSLACFIDGIPG